jgi:hypothetical protein
MADLHSWRQRLGRLRDIDSGLAVAVMRNGPPAGGLTAATRIDRLIAGTEEHQ